MRVSTILDANLAIGERPSPVPIEKVRQVICHQESVQAMKMNTVFDRTSITGPHMEAIYRQECENVRVSTMLDTTLAIGKCPPFRDWR